MKKVLVLLILCVGGTLNVSSQEVKKDTVLIGDSVTYPKIQEGKRFFAIYKGKKIRCAKGDKGKRAFIIYNTNVVGETRISKMYYSK